MYVKGQVRCFVLPCGVLPEKPARTQPSRRHGQHQARPRRRAQPRPPPHPRDLPPESGKMKQGYDCIVVARTRAAHADYWELKRAFEKNVQKARFVGNAGMKRFLLFLIRFYRRAISPYRPPCCRFIPTCSQYALEAIEKYGRSRAAGLPSSVSCGAIRSIRAEKSTTRSRDRT